MALPGRPLPICVMLSAAALVGLAGCSDDVASVPDSSVDRGQTGDMRPSADSGPDPDSASAPDSGQAADRGQAPDSSQTPDSSQAADSSQIPDTTRAADALQTVDAGTAADSVAAADATPTPAIWPLSSQCLSPHATSKICLGGVKAESWDRKQTYHWSLDNSLGNASTLWLLSSSGTPVKKLASIQSASFQGLSGLTVGPQGNFYLSGFFGGKNPITVAGTQLLMPDFYNSVIISLTSAGKVRWFRTFAGISTERIRVSARAKDEILALGDIFRPRQIGPFKLTGPQWLYDFYVALINSSGTWKWAYNLPLQKPFAGDFQFLSYQLTKTGGVAVGGKLRFKVTLNGKTYACPGTSTSCPATMLFDRNGKAQSITSP